MVKLVKTRGMMGSLDVESLFTNVPVAETTNIILEHVYRNSNLSPPTAISETTMRRLLELCTTGTPFRGINGDLYLQKDGVMMGSPLGPTFANYYMCDLENKIAQNYPDEMPVIYARYVDDIFILTNSRDSIEKLKSRFEDNSVLKFTYELEINSKLAFLDTLVTRQEELLTTSIYTKDTNNGDCINYLSLCPERYKTGVIKTLLHRGYKICSSWTSFHVEVVRIKQLLTNNSFPMAIIDKEVKKFLDKQLSNVAANENTQSNIDFYYRSQMVSSYKVEEDKLKKLIEENVKPIEDNSVIRLYIYYKNKKLKNLVIKNKYHKQNEEFNVVYQYTCPREECNSSETYIGYTETTLTERIRNHGQHGSIIKHQRETHDVNKVKTKELMESVKVLMRGSDRQELLIMEALMIKERRPTINSQEEGRDRILRIF